MRKDNKIILYIVVAVAAVAVCFMIIFGTHYLLGNPMKTVFAPDMKTFTVVTGEDYSTWEIAEYLRAMKEDNLPYMRITDSLYCTTAENGYENLQKMMAEQGYEYIGCDGTLINMRCFYKDGKARWVRVEYDMNEVWSLWNICSEFEYDLAKDGYKNMEH